MDAHLWILDGFHKNRLYILNFDFFLGRWIVNSPAGAFLSSFDCLMWRRFSLTQAILLALLIYLSISVCFVLI